jgi:hypothetical protein
MSTDDQEPIDLPLNIGFDNYAIAGSLCAVKRSWNFVRVLYSDAHASGLFFLLRLDHHGITEGIGSR